MTTVDRATGSAILLLAWVMSKRGNMGTKKIYYGIYYGINRKGV